MRRLSMLLAILLLSIIIAVPVASAESKPVETTITLQQAINMALQNDKGLKKAEAEIDRTKDLRDNAADKVNFTPVMGGTYDPSYELNWNNLLSADLAWQMSKKSLEASRDAVVLKTCKSYWDVQSAQEKVDVQRKLEQQALLNLQNVRAGLRAGTVPPSAIVAAEGQWQQAQNNLQAAKNALDDAYNTFNLQTGMDAGEKPILADNPNYEPLEITNLNYEVEKVIENSPSIWLSQQKVTLQKWAADMMFFTGQYTPYQARQIAVDQAELDAASASDLMKMVTRQLYYTTKSLEESYQAAQEAVKMAQENLRVTKVKFDAGMATKADIVAAEMAVSQAQLNLDSLTRQHAYMKLAFEKPWAASGSGGSTAGQSQGNAQ